MVTATRLAAVIENAIRPSSKQRELHDRLLDKTLHGKLRWSMSDYNAFFVEVGSYHVNLQRGRGVGATTMLTVRQSSRFLTAFPLPNSALFYAAQSHCEERQEVITEVMTALDRL